jgi:virginiamycin B lyase
VVIRPKTRYLLFIVVSLVAISSILLIFSIVPNNNANLFTREKDNINSATDNQQATSNSQSNIQDENSEYNLRGAVSSTSGGKQVLEKHQTYLCGGSFEKRTDFIREYTLPFPCSQPVGITIQQQQQNNTNSNTNTNTTYNTTNPQKVWVAATWVGYLAGFDPVSQRFTDFIEIPNWKTKGDFGSMVWDMEFDKIGNLWFTDQVNNAIWCYFPTDKRFEMYRVPTNGSYPSSIAFDSQGRVWFSEIFGKKLGMIEPAKATNNTSTGIVEYQLNMTEEEGFETMGPLVITNTTSTNNNTNSNTYNETVWFTAVNFPESGHVIKFDIGKKKFEVLKLPVGAGTPVGIVEDDNGRLWINDHATNLFFVFDPQTGKAVKYSTSLPSSRNNTTTLPYYNMYRDGKLWFNEHEGNAVAYFDIANLTLVEYQIPTKGEAWGNTSNPLQFTLDNNGSAWFTEWTENKIGVLDSEKAKNLPLWISTNSSSVDLDREKDHDGKAIKVLVYPNSSNLDTQTGKEPVEMTVAGTMSYTGKLWNITSKFDKEEFYFPAGSIDPQIITLQLTPDNDLVPGSYMLTVGARHGSVTYSKMVN